MITKKIMIQKQIFVINILFFAFIFIAGITTVTFFGKFFYQHSFFDIENFKVSFSMFLLFYILSHVVRLLRLFTILIEHKSDFKHFVSIYLITSWVNFIIPFKFGEFFRVSEFSKICRSFNKSIVSIWIERFLDSIVLCFTIVSVYIVNKGNINFIPLIIIVSLFIFFSVLFYVEYPYTFKYLNRFLIKKTSTKKGIYALEVAKILQLIHENIRILIRGKATVLLFLTIIVWLLELLALASLVRSFDVNSLMEQLVVLLNDVFLNQNVFDVIATYKVGPIFILSAFALLPLGKIIKHRIQEVKGYYEIKGKYNYKFSNEVITKEFGEDIYE